MAVSAVSGSTTSADATPVNGSKVLGQDDFLKLLVAELQNQDVFNPMQDKDMMAQLAQFNALDQMTQIKEMLTEFMGVQALSDAGNLIGKTVEVVQEEGDPITGVVSRVSMADGVVQVRVGDADYDLGLVIGILGEGEGNVTAES